MMSYSCKNNIKKKGNIMYPTKFEMRLVFPLETMVLMELCCWFLFWIMSSTPCMFKELQTSQEVALFAAVEVGSFSLKLLGFGS